MKVKIMDEQPTVNYNINVMTFANVGGVFLNPMMVTEVAPTEKGCDVYMVGGECLQFTVPAKEVASIIQYATVSFVNKPAVPGQGSRAVGHAIGAGIANMFRKR